jgi:hypothetical protein
MLIAHRIALDPNTAQENYLARAAGTGRHAFNWALGEWKRQATEWRDSGKTSPFPSEISLRPACMYADEWMRMPLRLVRCGHTECEGREIAA